jgi:protein-S-isoprenylcysteine O-methyltransferase Ste14
MTPKGFAMLVVALVLYIVWLIIGFTVRMAVQRRRTGNDGVRGFGAAPGTVAWWASLLLAVSHSGGIAGPIAGLFGLPSLPFLAHPALHVIGFVLVGIGLVASVLAQLSMGESWRIGVGQGERTDLVTGGPFAHVRNPIFTAVAITAGGFTLVVGNIVSLVLLGTLILALELQVRIIEEPHLRCTHGEHYRSYAGATGRFLPRVGRLPQA